MLQNIIFQDQPLLPGLLLELATLFAVRYKIYPTVPIMILAFQIHYQQHRGQLESHEYIIKLISNIIQDLNMWPMNDVAVEQSLFKTKEETKKRTKTLYDLETLERPIKKLWLDLTDLE